MGFRKRSVEGLEVMFWSGRRVFLTGHTGFKGGWLSLLLQHAGATVYGYSLAPPTTPSLFEVARVREGMESQEADIRDFATLSAAVKKFRPEVVIHMAAQPLVRRSYADPLETYTTNVIGTANVLEAVRHCDSVRSVVVITTDKVYENQEWCWPYRENDRLGGYDPYSNSKACAELVTSSFRNSFFHPKDHSKHGVAIASTRAGNVIGGGDWAEDRLLPDIITAFLQDRTLKIRNPKSIRPWQFVLEPLRGYMEIAQRLIEVGPDFGGAWNFGPQAEDAKSVDWIVNEIAAGWGPDAKWELDVAAHPHEAQVLKLDWSRASQSLDWKPTFTLKQALKATVDWYKAWHRGEDMRVLTLSQIEEHAGAATSQNGKQVARKGISK